MSWGGGDTIHSNQELPILHNLNVKHPFPQQKKFSLKSQENSSFHYSTGRINQLPTLEDEALNAKERIQDISQEAT